MILSVHNQFRGGFDYYESADSVGLNDDFPTPQLAHLRTKLGVPATLAGRTLPPGARHAGSGQLPRGTISSGKIGEWKKKGGGITSGLGEILPEASFTGYAAGVAAAVVSFLIVRRFFHG